MTDDNLLDLLADHAAGVLDPAAVDELTRRLAADPELAALANAVGAAQARVTADLADLPAAPMPGAVFDRLTAALSAAGDPGAPHPASSPGAGPAIAGSRPADSPAAGSRAADSPAADSLAAGSTGSGSEAAGFTGGGSGASGSNGSGRGRSRARGAGRPGGAAPAPGRPGGRTRWTRVLAAAGGVAAAAVLAIGGFAVLGRGGTSAGDSTATSGKAAQAPQYTVSTLIRHSGTDYTAATLPTGPEMGWNASTADGSTGAGVEPLSRLDAPAALSACLTAVAATHPGPVSLVEYARYQGQPALIIVVQDGSGSARTVVVGPDCGLPGSADDEIYPTPTR